MTSVNEEVYGVIFGPFFDFKLDAELAHRSECIDAIFAGEEVFDIARAIREAS